jgi:replicative DNA helicase
MRVDPRTIKALGLDAVPPDIRDSQRPPATQSAAAGAPWGHPVAFEGFDLPEFPTSELPRPLRDFVAAEAVATQTPPDLSGALVLACCAAALAKKIKVQVKPGHVEPVNLYIGVAMEPGSRKTTVHADVTGPIVEFEAAESDRLRPEVSEAAAIRRVAEEALKSAERRAASAKQEDRAEAEKEVRALARELASRKPPCLPRYLTDDCTPERLTGLLSENGGRIAVLSAEGGIFDQMAGRYSADRTPNLEVYLKGHAGDRIRVDRIGRPPEFIQSPALTIGIAFQPALLHSLADKPGFRGLGLLPRFLFVLPMSTVGRREADPPPVPGPVRDGYRHCLWKLLALPLDAVGDDPSTEHVIRLDPSARATLLRFAAWLEPRLAPHGEFGHIADWGSKLVGAIARIAGILHMAQHADEAASWTREITEGTVESAITLGRYFLAHAQAAFDSMGADRVTERARHILGAIRYRRAATFSAQQAFQWVRGRHDLSRMAPFSEALAVLEEREYIRRRPAEPREGPGRKPSPTYDVNPLLLAEYPHNPQNVGPPPDTGDSEDTQPTPERGDGSDRG